MRLVVWRARRPTHDGGVAATAVSWMNAECVVSAGDDRQLVLCTSNSTSSSSSSNRPTSPASANSHHQPQTTVSQPPPPTTPHGDWSTQRLLGLPEAAFPTSLHVLPPRPGAVPTKGSDSGVIAVSTSDGRLMLVSGVSGKIERHLEKAHRGAALSVRWTADGTALLSCGEDGEVRMWSRALQLRSVLAQCSGAVHSAAWHSSGTRLVHTHGTHLCQLSLRAQSSQAHRWRAHDGAVLCVDWAPVSGLIVSGGEDCRFRVWDQLGRPLFASRPHAHPVTAVAWTPHGDAFAVASLGVLRLCDKAGWTHSVEQHWDAGSAWSLAFSGDGTQLAAATASGHTLIAHTIGRRVTWKSLEAVQTGRNRVELRDLHAEGAMSEQLETRERVTRLSLAHHFLVLTTTRRFYVFSEKGGWNTPVMGDLRSDATGGGGCCSLIEQCDRAFLLLDASTAYVYSYDGRAIGEHRVAGADRRVVSLAADCLVLRDPVDQSLVKIVDPATGKPIGDGPLQHTEPVVEVRVEQHGGPIASRNIAFRDAKNNVFLALVNTYGVQARTVRIGTNVEQLLFSSETPQLAGLGDGVLTIWVWPSAAFVERSLLDRTTVQHKLAEAGKFPELVHFMRSAVTIRRSDGALSDVSVSPFVSPLLSALDASHWDRAIRLCRQVQDDALWAVLAGRATRDKNLYAAEVAYAALNEADKVSLLAEARSAADRDVRTAWMIALGGSTSDAEALLLKAGKPLLAILLCVDMHRWQRALQLAVDQRGGAFLDVVLGHRERYLTQMGRQETEAAFIQKAGQVEIDWTHINEVVAQECARELGSAK